MKSPREDTLLDRLADWLTVIGRRSALMTPLL